MKVLEIVITEKFINMVLYVPLACLSFSMIQIEKLKVSFSKQITLFNLDLGSKGKLEYLLL